MKAVGYIIKKVTVLSNGRFDTEYAKAITHRLYYHGDKIGNVPVVLAFQESH